MLQRIDWYLNRITMYRLVLYLLLALVGVAFCYSLLGLLPFNPWFLLANAAFLVAACWLLNAVFAAIFETPPAAESSYLTALILALIISPAAPSADVWFLFFASGIAMLAASMLAGLLWDRLGAAATFYAGAVFSVVALLILALRGRR